MWINNEKIAELLQNGAKSISDLFIENDRPIFQGEKIEEIADYIKENDILKLRD